MATSFSIVTNVDTSTHAIVPALGTGQLVVTPQMEFFSKKKLLNIPNVKTVALVIKDDEGQYVSFGHDTIAVNIAKASSPQIHTTLKARRQPQEIIETIETIELPPNDPLAYQRLFDAVQESFDNGQFTNVLTIELNDENKPLTEYYRMKKAATDLSMSAYKYDIEDRIIYLLFPNFGKKPFAVRASDIESVLECPGVTKGEEFYEGIANALGRAWAAKAIAKEQLQEIKEMLAKNDELKESFEGYKQKWSAKMKAGEDISTV